MFYVSDDEKMIVDSRARKVGFLRNGKFAQFVSEMPQLQKPDEPYFYGLSPLELEMVSETIQRNKMKEVTSGEGI